MPETAAGPWLGIDYGTRRIGIAVLGESGLAAQGVATLHNGPAGPDWPALSRIMREWRPRTVVMGLPLRADGSEGAVAKAARHFASGLQDRFGVPVLWMDEYLSSYAAESFLQECALDSRTRKRLRDQAAACEILHSFRQEHLCRANGM